MQSRVGAMRSAYFSRSWGLDPRVAMAKRRTAGTSQTMKSDCSVIEMNSDSIAASIMWAKNLSVREVTAATTAAIAAADRVKRSTRLTPRIGGLDGGVGGRVPDAFDNCEVLVGSVILHGLIRVTDDAVTFMENNGVEEAGADEGNGDGSGGRACWRGKRGGHDGDSMSKDGGPPGKTKGGGGTGGGGGGRGGGGGGAGAGGGGKRGGKGFVVWLAWPTLQ